MIDVDFNLSEDKGIVMNKIFDNIMSGHMPSTINEFKLKLSKLHILDMNLFMLQIRNTDAEKFKMYKQFCIDIARDTLSNIMKASNIYIQLDDINDIEDMIKVSGIFNYRSLYSDDKTKQYMYSPNVIYQQGHTDNLNYDIPIVNIFEYITYITDTLLIYSIYKNTETTLIKSEYKDISKKLRKQSRGEGVTFLAACKKIRNMIDNSDCTLDTVLDVITFDKIAHIIIYNNRITTINNKEC